MAEHDLIDGPIDAYLGELRRELGRRRDVEDVLAEVEDHLREVAAWHAERGMEQETAERHALGRFGRTATVVEAFDASGEGAAVPTTITKFAGLAAMVGGVLVVVVFSIGSVTDLDVGPRSGWFAPLGTTAFALVLMGVLGIHLRHRAIYTGAGRVGRWLIPVGVVGVIASVLTWFGPGVILAEAIIGTGSLLLGADVWRARVVDRRGIALIAVGIPSAMTVAVFGHTSYGWTPIASMLAMAGIGAGFAWIGYGLWREHPGLSRPPAATA